MIDKDNKYTKMQQELYDREAAQWSVTNVDPVVGAFHAHNNHQGYSLLFKDFDISNSIILDFGCGPGRNIAKYWSGCVRVDGCDISQVNLDKALLWVNHIYPSLITLPNLYKTDGISLDTVPSNAYDFVMSTIAMQHIPVYEIRYNIFEDMFRVLKLGGWITIQMGYGSGRQGAKGYYENHYEADGSNGMCDVLVTDPKQLEDDLLKIGFSNFSSTIAEVGPGDVHDNWIFFRAQKI